MKIGILSFYYGSTNYGGVLQAYSLTRILNEMGYDAEQICFDMEYCDSKLIKLKAIIKQVIVSITNPSLFYRQQVVNKELSKRKNAFARFVSEIPHSSDIYNNTNIQNVAQKYDVFITGSDQVWSGTSSAYFLEFVPKSKTKLSYAASIARNSLTEEQKKLIPSYCEDYKAISVREPDAVSLLKDVNVTAQYVLDPTLLMNREEWDLIVSKRIIEDEYVLCYFLAEDKREREYARKYADNYGLKLVTFPNMDERYHKSDVDFGDVRVFDASPNDFISLIKHANCIFTDSFHCTVFSCIYNKNFLTFERAYNGRSMNSRFTALLKMLNVYDHFVFSNQDIKDGVEINHERIEMNSSFSAMVEYSKSFLRENLE